MSGIHYSLAISGETSEAGYYTPEEIAEMDYMMPLHERIRMHLPGRRRRSSGRG
ncbi:MAG: hypothetical protein K8R77_10835 [Anaerolineaceae bacterium]|nr:hypothetical protein [Anaerolineaceae bacterium]